jgi:transcriptional regulator with PAS, ATPase and Fis domain
MDNEQKTSGMSGNDDNSSPTSLELSLERNAIAAKKNSNSEPPITAQQMFERMKRLQQATVAQRLAMLGSTGIITQRETKQLAAQHRASEATGIARLQEGQPAMKFLERFITADPELIKVKDQVKILAVREEPVLILGDSGTGKELIAQALHGNRSGKFVAINCAAISENLIESELFGHTKGSFTGAVSDRAGLLLEAHDGTAFLDEIGDLPYVLQAKLLRAIQNRVVRRVGSNTDESINCRIVAATHKDLKSVLNYEHGGFRLDLYYRLSTFKLVLKNFQQRSREDFDLITRAEGGTEEDAQYLWSRRETISKSGNYRSVQQYFLRKRVLGVQDLD